MCSPKTYGTVCLRYHILLKFIVFCELVCIRKKKKKKNTAKMYRSENKASYVHVVANMKILWSQPFRDFCEIKSP